MGTFDERATTSLFENHAWRPSSTVSKEIIINLPTCWRHVPIFDLGSFTHFHTGSLRRNVFPVVGSDTKHNDNLHFTTLLITSHPSSPYYTHVCNTNEKKRKGKAAVHKAHSNIVGGNGLFPGIPKKEKKCDNDGF